MALSDRLEAIPPAQRWLLLIIVIGGLGGGYYNFFYKDTSAKIERLGGELGTLKTTYAANLAVAKKLPQFKQEVEELDRHLTSVLAQLPAKKEIPDLLIQISTLGLQSGVEFTLFQPQKDTIKDFYAEIPVKVQILSDYNSVATFFDKLSKLERITNITGLRMSGAKMVDGQLKISIDCTATAFRFVEPQEKAAIGKETKETKK